jgi:CrcB protein
VILPPILLVFIGGGIGALCRYGFSWFITQFWGGGFPVGTLFVNLLGCFLIGIVYSLTQDSRILSPSTRLFLMTGLLGGFTTFSSYGLESVTLALQGEPLPALINVMANNMVGFALVLAGIWMVKLF